MTGTSGRSAASADETATAGRMTAEQHAEAIQGLVDEALTGSSGTVTVNRSTLEQIRSHARAIAHGKDGGR